MNEEIRKFILSEAKIESLTTWWMSDFYERFCKFMGYDFEEILKNARKMRYYLNQLVKTGELVAKSGGTGECGQSDFGMTHMNNWFLVE